MKPPAYIDGAKVLFAADLEDSEAKDTTRHVTRDGEIADFSGLAIVQYDGEEGVYLLYCDDDWRALTDTLHDDVADAVAQADFEFEPVVFFPV